MRDTGIDEKQALVEKTLSTSIVEDILYQFHN